MIAQLLFCLLGISNGFPISNDTAMNHNSALRDDFAGFMERSQVDRVPSASRAVPATIPEEQEIKWPVMQKMTRDCTEKELEFAGRACIRCMDSVAGMATFPCKAYNKAFCAICSSEIDPKYREIMETTEKTLTCPCRVMGNIVGDSLCGPPSQDPSDSPCRSCCSVSTKVVADVLVRAPLCVLCLPASLAACVAYAGSALAECLVSCPIKAIGRLSACVFCCHDHPNGCDVCPCCEEETASYS